MDDLARRLEAASKKRDQLALEQQRVEARLEVAESSLAAVEAECRAKGVDPANIDEVVARLQARYADLVVQVEAEVVAAEAAMAPFIKETVG